jgi:hypothetical protein
VGFTGALIVVTVPVTTLVARFLHALGDKREKSPSLSLVTTGLFCVLLSVMHSNHEMWRDEIHCWSLARNATGLWDLLTGIRRYDGHPFLWYYLLHVVSWWSRSVAYLHVVAVMLATASAYLWVRYSNLPRFLRLMLLGTYYFFFEYGVISRSYVLGVFLVFLFCRFYDPRSLRIFRLAPILALLSFTSLYGVLLGISLGVFLGWQSAARLLSGQLLSWQRRLLYHQWLCMLALGAFVAFVHYKTSLPPVDSYYTMMLGRHPGTLSAEGFSRQFWSALFPWRTRNDGVWIVSSFLGDGIPFIAKHFLAIATAVLALWILALRKVPAAACAFFVGVLFISLFQKYQPGAFLRYWGHSFVLLIACIWLHAQFKRPRAILLYVLTAITFTVQIATCERAVRAEIDMPFSSALEAANYLRSQGYDKMPILATYDHAASAVAGYLDRRFLWAETGEEAQTVVFHNRRNDAPSVHDILVWARGILEEARTPVILLVNFDPEAETLPDLDMEWLYTTKPCLRADEMFSIYRLSLRPAPKRPR